MITEGKKRILKIFTYKIVLTKISIDLTDHILYALSRISKHVELHVSSLTRYGNET